jgi:hypothetical protein
MMSPRSCSKDVKAAIQITINFQKSNQQGTKNFRTAVLNHAALIVRTEQRRSWNGRVGRGFMKEMVDTYHEQRQVWVTKYKIQYAVKKMKALDSNIPTEKFHPVAIIPMEKSHPVAIIDVRMGSSESVVSSLGLYGAENVIHHSLLSESSESTVSSDSSVSTTSSDSSVSTASTASTASVKQAQQLEEQRQRHEKYEEERRNRHEKYEEEARKRRERNEEEARKRREEHRQNMEKYEEEARMRCEKHEERMQRMSKPMTSMVQLSRDCREAEKSNNSTLKRTLETMMFRTMVNALQVDDDDEVNQELRSKLLKMVDNR